MGREWTKNIWTQRLVGDEMRTQGLVGDKTRTQGLVGDEMKTQEFVGNPEPVTVNNL